MSCWNRQSIRWYDTTLVGCPWSSAPTQSSSLVTSGGQELRPVGARSSRKNGCERKAGLPAVGVVGPLKCRNPPPRGRNLAVDSASQTGGEEGTDVCRAFPASRCQCPTYV